MGGSKNKSPAQKEKSQKKETSKKSKKTEKGNEAKTATSVQKLLKNGTVERVGGFSGHHLYRSVSVK